MTTSTPLLIPALWIAWALYWWLSAFTAKDAVRKEPLSTRASHAIPLIVAILLLEWPTLPGDFLTGRMLPAGLETFWTGVAILVMGLAFMVWAKRSARTTPNTAPRSRH